MIANAGNQSSPLLAGVGGVVPRPSDEKSPGMRDEPSVVANDGASSISHAGSATAGGNEGPFNAHDAAIMADAFRKMLRKPDFAGQPVEDEAETSEGKEETEEMINRELAEEGRDIRSVRSERGVKVETHSDAGDTMQEHGRD